MNCSCFCLKCLFVCLLCQRSNEIGVETISVEEQSVSRGSTPSKQVSAPAGPQPHTLELLHSAGQESHSGQCLHLLCFQNLPCSTHCSTTAPFYRTPQPLCPVLTFTQLCPSPPAGLNFEIIPFPWEIQMKPMAGWLAMSSNITLEKYKFRIQDTRYKYNRKYKERNTGNQTDWQTARPLWVVLMCPWESWVIPGNQTAHLYTAQHHARHVLRLSVYIRSTTFLYFQSAGQPLPACQGRDDT